MSMSRRSRTGGGNVVKGGTLVEVDGVDPDFAGPHPHSFLGRNHAALDGLDLVVPGVGGQVGPFRVQVHGRVVVEVPQRDRAQGGTEVDLMVPDLNGRIHPIFDPGGRPLH